ncbi:ribose-phosphate pyrophosphokinase [Sulfuriflexus sp.]|uniref:ribose-phosphate diphosphokinase n=1 Tax=Sulfuriflexus sp. TaxID=2015443 RepID=UPI0028CF04E7|nr:ribose-phosphate pyrophosphokinase [Sulfuriflexus sp.]MDT8405248.1 ribose-phosphate pyrophosphokinase [Sulfuriflexus sp.]
MHDTGLRIFTLNASRDFARDVTKSLGISLGEHEERDFLDGEHKARILENVRGKDVFVIQSLHSDEQQSVNDKLIRLLWFLGSIRDASAGRVTVVIPYLCYARKERKTKSRDPVSSRYLAAILEAVGIDRVMTLDVHNLAAYQNAFRIHSEHLEAKKLFVDYFSAQQAINELVVVSPDVGGVKRAELFRQALQARLGRAVGSGFMEKQRSAGVVSGETLVGNVKGKAVIILDDLISSGATIARTVKACHQAGAGHISATASHGLFVANADEVLADTALDKLVVTNTIPAFRLHSESVKAKLVILNVAPLFGEAIRRIHEGGSIVELLATGDDTA